jgi:hypothetical protein
MEEVLTIVVGGGKRIPLSLCGAELEVQRNSVMLDAEGSKKLCYQFLGEGDAIPEDAIEDAWSVYIRYPAGGGRMLAASVADCGCKEHAHLVARALSLLVAQQKEPEAVVEDAVEDAVFMLTAMAGALQSCEDRKVVDRDFSQGVQVAARRAAYHLRRFCNVKP